MGSGGATMSPCRTRWGKEEAWEITDEEREAARKAAAEKEEQEREKERKNTAYKRPPSDDDDVSTGRFMTVTSTS